MHCNARGLVLAALIVAVSSSCRAQSVDRPTPDAVISGDGLASVRVCARLDSVAAVYPDARDTLLSSEGESWPGKAVSLGDGLVVFEASWSDREHVWGIHVTSTAVSTRRGYRVGTPIAALLQAGEVLTPGVSEGMLTIRLESEQIDFDIDSVSNAAFATHSDPLREPVVHDIPRGATIRSLFAVASCPRPR